MPSPSTLPRQFTLASGHILPAIGFGTWNNHDEASLLEGIRQGYRHIDTAAIYKNEKMIGKVLQQTFQNSELTRKDFFITSKLWNTCHEPHQAHLALSQSLENLGTNYLDLYLIHWPLAFERAPNTSLDALTSATDPNTGGPLLQTHISLEETWKALEEEVKGGRIKSLGVSNFGINQLERIKKIASVPISVNQFEFHPYFPRLELIDYCKKHKIIPIAYRSVGATSKEGGVLINDPVVSEVASKEQMTHAQVLLAFCLQHGAAIIPKSTSSDHIRENLQLKPISSHSFDALNAITRRHRYVDPVAIWHLKECDF